MTRPHANIVQFYQALKTTNNVYMFLELCDQGDLKHFLKTRKQKRMVEDEARHVIKDVLKGLRHLS